MPDYIVIILRTLLLYASILVIFRLMGKREIGELSVLDLVVFIMMGEMAAIAIENFKSPISHTLMPMIILLVIQTVLAFISLKSSRFRKIVDGSPTIVINKGKIDENAMRKIRYNFDDLLTQLRTKDINNIADVEFAILETSGELSIIKKDKKKKKVNTFTQPLIMDGQIIQENLQKTEKSEMWLRRELRKRGYPNINDISLCSFQDGQFYIDLIDERE
ncbi:DUF421 domain-containing protein [Bacillus sp. FJAT-49736]|uniref:DUF421 domain-containing protein n=1 Tax=Bacillus sp. FJAT-49736 TaxID=2833582 RepID=UPI001BCA48C3|nr:DUF421 domain-containing protein [Bacillus sp. FJAT-49736]MBS4173670.1 DUF421 domain-containing protein [Bacillus sp. FJAT-49736]